MVARKPMLPWFRLPASGWCSGPRGRDKGRVSLGVRSFVPPASCPANGGIWGASCPPVEGETPSGLPPRRRRYLHGFAPEIQPRPGARWLSFARVAVEEGVLFLVEPEERCPGKNRLTLWWQDISASM